MRQSLIENRISGRCRVETGEVLEVGIDAVGKGQVHQHRTGEDVFHRPAPGWQE